MIANTSPPTASDVFISHDLIRENIDPRTDHEKRRRAFQLRGDKRSGACAGGQMHFSREHGLDCHGRSGFDDLNIQAVFLV